MPTPKDPLTMRIAYMLDEQEGLPEPKAKKAKLITNLQGVMARAASDVEKWPEWRRSEDVQSELGSSRRIRPPPKLTFDVLPSGCIASARACVSPEIWDTLRRRAYERALYCCEICKGVGPEWPVVRRSGNSTKVWALRLRALCPECRRVSLASGTAFQNWMRSSIEASLQKVNDWTSYEAQQYCFEQLEIWTRRNRILWDQDISILQYMPG